MVVWRPTTVPHRSHGRKTFALVFLLRETEDEDGVSLRERSPFPRDAIEDVFVESESFSRSSS